MNECKYDECTDDANDVLEYPNYCGRHQIKGGYYNSVIATGRRPCAGYTRACRNVLDNDCEYKNCEDCRNKKKKEPANLNKKTKYEKYETYNKIHDDTKMCSHKSCGKRVKNVECFIGEKGQICKHCNDCRVKGQAAQDKYKPKKGLAQKYELDLAIEEMIRGIERRNIKLELNYDEIATYMMSSCYYCKKIITFYKKKLPKKIINTCNYMGIDRKDSDDYYKPDNCVTACKFCNMIKGTIHHDIFMKHCCNILFNLGYINFNDPCEINDNASPRYAAYKCDAKKREKNFDLTKDEYKNITKNNCYLCNKKNSTTHKNGIDRIINNIGYTYLNCRSCCGTCNFIKKNYLLLDFLAQIYSIVMNHYPQSNNLIKEIKQYNKIIDSDVVIKSINKFNSAIELCIPYEYNYDYDVAKDYIENTKKIYKNLLEFEYD
jgi:hypothetical protein